MSATAEIITEQSMTASTPDAPVAAADRIAMMDVLRGFAVMAIFIVNIKGMVMPFAFYMNPEMWGSEFDSHIAMTQKFLVDDKWRTTFTALFGAGIVLISDKAMANGNDRAGLLYRRNLFLLLFGLIHMIGIWIGDILVLYALTGLVAIRFRKMGTRKLFAWAVISFVLGLAWMSAFNMAPLFVPEMSEMATKMEGMMWGSDAKMLAEEIEIFQGGVLDQLAYRGISAAMMIPFFVVLSGFWLLTLSIMLFGMGFYRAGLLQGQWRVGKCLTLAAIFLVLAWGLDAVQWAVIHDSENTYEAFVLFAPLATVDGMFGSFGYACLVAGLVGWGVKFRAVAAVGRMAFTNYITCSLIGTTIAGGHAFGYYGTVTNAQLMVVVVATFVGMLIWSPLWLSMFRFGPLEWLWRSLTYGQMQPFRK